MIRSYLRCICAALICAASVQCSGRLQDSPKQAKRLVILKVDGLGADLLYRNMREQNPSTGQPRLPWFAHIFAQNGAVFENFYTRGISLSAPSWSMLDTGRHTVIRGNVEWDRWTGEVYDYLNFFPFYLGYARNRQVDMRGVQVLDEAGIPLVMDAYPYASVFQSFQLFQRGARWTTLKNVLERRFSSQVLIPLLEGGGAPSLDEMLGQQTERELMQHLAQPEILYLDYYTGDVDHEGHASNNEAALLAELRKLDALSGRIWTAIQKSPLAAQTLFVVVSDHGMNNVAGVQSQGFSLPDFFNSPQGGAQHVMLNRHELSDYKLRGLNPLVKRAFAQSTATYYLPGQADQYPTVWLDVDGNERASVSLRNNDWNKIHILLLQLANPDLKTTVRSAGTAYLKTLIDQHRTQWSEETDQLSQELNALQAAIETRKSYLAAQRKRFNREDYAALRRKAEELSDWEREFQQYAEFIGHIRALLNLRFDGARFTGKVSDYIPEMSLGDRNSVYDLQNYVVGPGASGLILDASGKLDDERSFRRLNYFPLLTAQRVRNNPQPQLSSRPIDFTALRLSSKEKSSQEYWLYVNDDDQLLIREDETSAISLCPVSHLVQYANGKTSFVPVAWHSGLPLKLFEDPELNIPAGTDRSQWLSAPHSEYEWMTAIHHCAYSNGVIGIIEELSPVGANVPGHPNEDAKLLEYERRRRELVQPDFEVFAADHWNFNVRNFNPGGNHGAFFRISTHSVWMMAGAGISVQDVSEPYDSLNFASTVLHLVGKATPMPDRVVRLNSTAQPTEP